MSKFFVITKFNLKFLFSNWMTKIFIVLLTSIILISSLYYKHKLNNNENNEKVLISVDDMELTNALSSFEDKIKLVKSNPDIEIYKNSESNIKMIVKNEKTEEESISYIYEVIDSIVNPKSFNIEVIKEFNKTESIIGIVSSLLIYVSVLFVGNIIITSVSLEKTSRMLDLISYKVNSITLVYGKCLAILIYIFSLIVICMAEIGILDYFDIINVESIIKNFNLNNLDCLEWFYLFLSLLVALFVYMQLYVVTALFISDASQLQLSQLPMTLLTFSCYSLNLLSLMDTKFKFLLEYTRFIPFSFPFGILLKIFVFDDITKSFLLTGISISILFIIISFYIIKKYLLPKRMV